MKFIFFFALVLMSSANIWAQDNAPGSVAGRSAVVVISNGTGPFASIGGYRVSFSPATYSVSPLAPTVAPTAGVYSYSKTGANTAQLLINDSTIGIGVAQNLVFSSSTTASFSIAAIGGTQTGTFVLEGGTLSSSPATGDRLTNMSVRAQVPTDAAITPGFVLEQPSRVLIRVAGPALAAFGVAGTLANPKLTVFGGSTAIASNDDWSSTSANQASVIAAGSLTGAFAYAAGSRDAAVVLDLQRGAYTASITGDAGSTGEVLLEVYLVP